MVEQSIGYRILTVDSKKLSDAYREAWEEVERKPVQRGSSLEFYIDFSEYI